VIQRNYYFFWTTLHVSLVGYIIIIEKSGNDGVEVKDFFTEQIQNSKVIEKED